MTNVTTNTDNKSNDLRFSTCKTVGKKTIYVKIRLNDECKNGHQDFSITGDIYEAEKPKIDKYHISGGCIHDAILKHFPEYTLFVKLHLCDYEGIPMYAVENGYYHLTNGFNNTKPEQPNFKDEFCEYYRITGKQFNALKTAKNKLQYALMLQSLNILQQWKYEATAAIDALESMTGKIFVVDSVKTQFHAPTPEAIKEEETKQATGYYTPEAEQQREEAKQTGILAELEADRDKEINKATEEFEVKKQVLLIGGEKALKNCIYYNHSKTLSFNWRSYDMISNEMYTKIAESIQLPENVKIENKEGN